MSYVETVAQNYEDFQRGQVAAILAKLSDDVAWNHWDSSNSGVDAGIAYLVPRTGRAQVGEFFQALVDLLEFHEVTVLSLFEGDRQVAARIRFDVTARKRASASPTR